MTMKILLDIQENWAYLPRHARNTGKADQMDPVAVATRLGSLKAALANLDRAINSVNRQKITPGAEAQAGVD